MWSSYVILIVLEALAYVQSVSIFQQSFEEVVQKLPPPEMKGVTPQDTYPLVIQPLNFAPAVVAPPANLYLSQIFGSKSTVSGAIPLFKPLESFPYIKYLPVSTSFYLNEPNVRNPFASIVGDDLPTKVSAPKPSFISIQDAQISRRPSKDKILDEIKQSDPNIKESSFSVTFESSIVQENVPTKVSEPRPASFSVQDAQLSRRPSNEQIVGETKQSDGILNEPFEFSLTEENAPIKASEPRPSSFSVQDAQLSRRPSNDHIVGETKQSDGNLNEPLEFSLAEENVPTKMSEPRPASFAVQDAQLSRRPSNEQSFGETKQSDGNLNEPFESPLAEENDPIKASEPRPASFSVQDAQLSRRPSNEKFIVEESLLDPYAKEEDLNEPFLSFIAGENFPSKVSAPIPAFISVHDAQLRRRPSKENLVE